MKNAKSIVELMRKARMGIDLFGLCLYNKAGFIPPRLTESFKGL